MLLPSLRPPPNELEMEVKSVAVVSPVRSLVPSLSLSTDSRQSTGMAPGGASVPEKVRTRSRTLAAPVVSSQRELEAERPISCFYDEDYPVRRSQTSAVEVNRVSSQYWPNHSDQRQRSED